jgi:hypothetical protein
MNSLRKSWRAVALLLSLGAMTIGLSTAANASTLSPAAYVRPLGLTSVNPVNDCGGFKGDVSWSENSRTRGGSIHIWGDLWDNKCSGHPVYLFVNYTLVPGGPYEYFSLGSAGYSKSGNVGIDWNNSKSHQNFSGIGLRVCNTSTGKDCGNVNGV